MRTGIIKIVLVFLFVTVLGLLGGIAYQNFLSGIKIIKSPLIKDKTKLKEFLEVNELFGPPLRYVEDDDQVALISAIYIKPQSYWKQTDDCIGPAHSRDLLFCFDETVQGKKLTINVYPNNDAINEYDNATPTRLLNFNLASILEDHFKISQNKGSIIMGADGQGAVFKW